MPEDIEDKNPMPIRLQLNSERVVRKLIDGDPELEVAIKKAVIQNIAMEKVVAAVTNAAIYEVNNTFLERRSTYSGVCLLLKPEYKKIIIENTDDQVKQTVRQELKNIEKIIDEHVLRLEEKIDAKIEKLISGVADFLVSDSIQKHIDKKVDEKLAAIKTAIDENTHTIEET